MHPSVPKTPLSMFEFGQDFSDFLLKNGASFNNSLLHHVLRAQKRHFEEANNPLRAFDLYHQFSQGSESIPEFCRLLEAFFNCIAKVRTKNEPSQNDGISGHIIWPSKPHPSSQPPAVPSTSSSSSRLPSPSVPLPKKQLSKAEKSRTRVDEVLGPSEFTTPALNSLIEMTLSNSYQLGNSNEISKGKHKMENNILLSEHRSSDCIIRLYFGALIVHVPDNTFMNREVQSAGYF